MFQKSILVPKRVIIFGAIWAQTPFFGPFYLKSYDDEIWYVGTLCDLRPKAELLSSLSGREAPVVRRKAHVLLPAVGGFQFGRNPNILFARNRSGNVRVRRKRIINKLFVTLSFPYPRTKPIMFCFADNFRDWLIRW